MRLSPSLLFLSASAATAYPSKQSSSSHCASISGDKTINSFQLYPENAAFDESRCSVYFSSVYNATVAVWDPYVNAVIDSIKFKGLSGDPLLHTSGVKVDPLGRLSVVVDAGAAFDTEGQDISGDNFLVKYDLKTRRELWRRNLTALTNGVYSGYQDIEHDERGNTFVIGTFPSSIIRVSTNNENASQWYLATPPDHTKHGYTGVVSVGDSLIVPDNADGQLYRFNKRDKEGKPSKIPLTGNSPIGLGLDGAVLPSLYSGTVLLVSDNTNGTIVLHSADGKWNKARNVGTIANKYLNDGGSTVASLEIGSSIYAVTEYFGDAKVEGTLAGNRTQFPLTDITKQIAKLLK
ncbi:hypothetical protein N0V84_007416 [Fusarium piperis]|uniref:Tri14-like protein n=1 Tax=Fusarium piperis TaxID=1435070 RepID=A0A9W9BLH9_9HYPO|nr:hypothetical protein N0V84_007416 [Fusarium piperis]